MSGQVSAATVTVQLFDDASGSFARRGWMDSNSLFQRNLRAAAAQWGALIRSDATIKVGVVVSSNRGASTRAYTGATIASQDGLRLVQLSALSRALGTALPTPNATDMDLQINPDYTDQFFWIDTEPETRSGVVPATRSDMVSVALHEMGHGLAFYPRRGNASPNGFATFPDTSRTTFDLLSNFSGDGTPANGNVLQFTGPMTQLVNDGSPLHLSFLPAGDAASGSNFAHIGSCYDTNPRYRAALMNGCQASAGGNWYDHERLTSLDLAVLSDVGYPLNSAYFPGEAQLMAATLVNGSMYSLRLKLADAKTLDFELVGLGLSNQAGTDTSFDPVNLTLTMANLVIADTPQQYRIVLRLLPDTNPLRFRLQSLAPAN